MLSRLLSELIQRRKAAPAPAVATSLAPAAVPAPHLPAGADGEWRQRLSSRPIDSLTVLVPFLPGREPFLKAMLDHLEFVDFHPAIRMSVSFDGESHEDLLTLISQYPRQRIEVMYHPRSVSFFERLALMAKSATTPYVFVHSDDDFVVPRGLDVSIRFLDTYPDYVACQGRSAFLSVSQEQSISAVAQLFLMQDHDAPLVRIGRHCKDFTTTFHAITRREPFVRAHEGTAGYTSNVIFLQYLASCWLLAIGKLGIVPDVHYLRYDNPRGERSTLIRNRDKGHWPYLIVAPDFSSELMRFRSGLAGALAEQGLTADEGWLDTCCLDLTKRAFGLFRQPSSEEARLTAEMMTPGTDLHALVQHCAALAIDALAKAHRAEIP